MASPTNSTQLLDTASFNGRDRLRINSATYASGLSRTCNSTIEDAATESAVGSIILATRPRSYSTAFLGSSGHFPVVREDDEASVAESSVGKDSLSLSSSLRLVGNTSWMAAVIIMTNCTIGMGLLSFPKSFADAGGLSNGLATMSVIVLLVLCSLAMLGKCCLRCGEVSFQAVIEYYAGRWFGLMAKMAIFINNFGACVVFLVVLGDQAERIVWLVSPAGLDICATWYLDRRFLVSLVGILVIMPLCMPSNFEVFKYTSFLGVSAATFVAFGVAMPRYITGVRPPEPAPASDNPPLQAHFLKIIPIICFCFECHIEIPPMTAVLKERSQSYFMKMVLGYLFLSTLVYTVGGVFGFLSFGEFVNGDFLLSYDRKDPLVSVATFLLVLKVTSTFPVLFYCLRSVVLEVWLRIDALQSRVPSNSVTLRVLLTIVMFIITLGMALVSPGISEAISLIGALSGLCIFVFPGLCFMQLMLGTDVEASKLQRRLGVFAAAAMVVFGTYLVGSVFTMNVRDFLAKKKASSGFCP